MERKYKYNCVTCGKYVEYNAPQKNKKGECVCVRCKNIDYTGYPVPFMAPGMKEKSQQAMLKKYGAITPFGVKKFRDKAKETIKERYGVDNYAKTEEYKEKVKKISLEKYGVDHLLKSKDIQEKIHNTVFERYGVKSVYQIDGVQQKAKDTMIKKYGVPYPRMSPEITKKMNETMMKRYGVMWAPQSKQIRQKAIESYLRRFGVDSPLLSPEIRFKINKWWRDKRNDPAFISRQILLARQDGYEYLEQKKIDDETYITYFCPNCRKEFVWCFKDDHRHAFCKNCAEEYERHISLQIRDYLRELTQNKNLTSKKLNDIFIDIYVPDKKIGIIVDSVLHDGYDNSYIFEECKNNDIRIIQLSDYEWIKGQDKVKDYLARELGLLKDIDINDCKVDVIDGKTFKDFCCENFINNNTNSSIKLGLFYGNELVYIMAFKKSRKSGILYKLSREGNKIGYDISKAREKLFNYFLDKYSPESVIIYLDRGKYVGNFLDYNYDYITNSKVLFFKDYNSINLYDYSKKVLKNKLKIYDDKLTCLENIRMNGYKAYYRYGVYVFTIRR